MIYSITFESTKTQYIIYKPTVLHIAKLTMTGAQT